MLCTITKVNIRITKYFTYINFYFKAEEASEEGASAEELGVDNVGGVFVVLGIGCGMAAAMGGLEFLWHIRDVAVEQKVYFILIFMM